MRRFLVVGWLALCAALALLLASPARADQPTPVRPVLVLGDSLSAAYGIRVEQGWVALLEKRLAEMRPPRPVVNASISGETTAGGLARLPTLLATHKPGLVLIELGANDGLRGLPHAQIRANLEKLIALVQGAGAEPVLIGIELPVNYGPRYRDELRAIYRDLAQANDLPLVPFLLEGVALDASLMQDDGLHPKAEAQPKILETVWGVVSELPVKNPRR